MVVRRHESGPSANDGSSKRGVSTPRLSNSKIRYAMSRGGVNSVTESALRATGKQGRVKSSFSAAGESFHCRYIGDETGVDIKRRDEPVSLVVLCSTLRRSSVP